MSELCQACDAFYPIVYRIDDVELWDRIRPTDPECPAESGLLCPACADRRARDIGVELYWTASAEEFADLDPEPRPVVEGLGWIEHLRECGFLVLPPDDWGHDVIAVDRTGNVLGTVYRSHPCGCETQFDTEQWHSVTIRQCAEHEAITARVRPSTTEEQQSAGAELVGCSEAAAILGVSKQRVTQLAAAMPPPVARLRAGPVWWKADVERFAACRNRTPGRPSTTEEPT